MRSVKILLAMLAMSVVAEESAWAKKCYRPVKRRCCAPVATCAAPTCAAPACVAPSCAAPACATAMPTPVAAPAKPYEEPAPAPAPAAALRLHRLRDRQPEPIQIEPWGREFARVPMSFQTQTNAHSSAQVTQGSSGVRKISRSSLGRFDNRSLCRA